jgi:hypothetical protein
MRADMRGKNCLKAWNVAEAGYFTGTGAKICERVTWKKHWLN